MTRLQHLTHTMDADAFIISNPTSILYLTGHEFEVGERLLALIITKDSEPLLFLNEMFSAPTNIRTHSFKDSDDLDTLLNTAVPNGTIAVDGTFNARFLIPLLSPTRTIVNGSRWIDAQRAVKDPQEQAYMIDVSLTNDAIMAELPALFKEGVSEIEIADYILKKQSTFPLEGPSFTPIVLFSEHIADPHGVPSTRTLKKGDAILVDMGGIKSHYCSDMTRTFFYGKNEMLENLYDIVLEANMKAIEKVKPGIMLKEVDQAARDVITKAGYGPFFIHRTGHGIGLECHETLDVSSSNETIIKEGMCFSIEPGIYIKGQGGIRIEDLVLVTKDGCKVLNHYPKERERVTFIED